MKMNNLLRIAALILCVFSVDVSSQSETIQAANGCQPRLYTQIDFFKISSGALKNDSSTAKSIICSIETQYDVRFDPGVGISIGAWLSYESRKEEVPCTLFMRRRGTGSLIESETVNLRRGRAEKERVGVVVAREFDEGYAYIQCALPAGARVFSVDSGAAPD